ncbi:MAG TPA: serine hydrolase [Bacteroidia bacterium]|jgi:D-alanyl-D-alanine carboxypeptidase
MKKISLLLTACSLIAATGGTAQTVPLLLESKLNNTLDSMQVYINNKSLSASIQLSNTAIWSKAAGISSLVPYSPAATTDTYEIGSVAKTMTAACVLHLVDQGLLTLDDSLHEWIDTIPHINPDITIRQLLRHQSGIYEVLSNPAHQSALLADTDSIWSALDFISAFIQPAPGVPGGSFAYNNTGYFLLGMIIEEVTGNPFQSEIRSRFLTPLNLNTLAIPSLEPFSSPVAHVWIDTDGDGVTEDDHTFFYNWRSLNSAVAAAGGYYGTASDVSQWMRSYMRGDLHSAGIMSQAKSTITAGGMPATYGLGLMRKLFSGLVGYGHGGDLAYSASSWYFPSKDISITVLNNDADITSWQLVPVVNALLQSYNQWEAITTTVSELDLSNISISAYPNPFKNDLSLSLHINGPVASVRMVLTNTLGEEVASLERENLTAGDHLIGFEDLTEITSGMYFVTTSLDGQAVKTVKVVK